MNNTTTQLVGWVRQVCLISGDLELLCLEIGEPS